MFGKIKYSMYIFIYFTLTFIKFISYIFCFNQVTWIYAIRIFSNFGKGLEKICKFFFIYNIYICLFRKISPILLPLNLIVNKNEPTNSNDPEVGGSTQAGNGEKRFMIEDD